MEADQRGRSEGIVGEYNESTISATAGGSVDLLSASGTVFNRWTAKPDMLTVLTVRVEPQPGFVDINL